MSRAATATAISLTLKLFGLAQLHAPVRRLVSYATPLMRELAETSHQANQLVVFDRGSAVVIAQQEAPGYWGISIRVGSHISLFDTGSGHVLLAFRSHEERRMMIAENVKSSEKPPVTPEFFAAPRPDPRPRLRDDGERCRRPASSTCRRRCSARTARRSPR